MANNEVKLIISADGTAAVAGIKQAEGALKGLGSSTESVFSAAQAKFLAFAAAAATAAAIFKKAWDMASVAAQHEEQSALLNRLAAQYNTTATQIVSDITRASDGMISLADATEIAASGLQKNLKPEQLNELSKAAVTLSDFIGTDATTAFKELTQAVATGRSRMLESAVGVIDLKEKYGYLADQMTDAQKQQATYNILIEKAKDLQRKLGDEIPSTADNLEKLTAEIKNISGSIGKDLIPALVEVSAAFMTWLTGLKEITSFFKGDEIDTVNKKLKLLYRDLAGLEEAKQGYGPLSAIAKMFAGDNERIKAEIAKYEEMKAKLTTKDAPVKQEMAITTAATTQKAMTTEYIKGQQARLMAQIETAKQAFAQQKSDDALALAQLENQHKLAQVSDEAYYALRETLINDNAVKEKALLDTQEPLLRNAYAWKEKLAKEAIEKEAVRTELKAKLAEMEVQKHTITNEAIKASGDLTTTQTLEQHKQLVAAMQNELEIKKTIIQAGTDAALEGIKQQEEKTKWLYDHAQISEQEFLAASIGFEQQRLAVVLAGLEAEFAARAVLAADLLGLENTTADERMKILNQLSLEWDKYMAGREKTTAETITRIAAIEREANKGSRLDQMLKEWTDYKKQVEDIIITMYRDMSAAFSNLFYDAITGDLKKLKEYFKDFFKNILKGFTDMLGKAVTADIMGAFTGKGSKDAGVASLFGSLTGTGTGTTAGTTTGNYTGSDGVTYTSTGEIANGLSSVGSMGTKSNPTSVNIVGIAGAALAGFGAIYSGVKTAGLTKESGAMAGAAAGAAMGTIILPGWGTLIGALIGAVSGWSAGSKKAAMFMKYTPGATAKEDLTDTGWQGGQSLNSTGLYSGLSQHGADLGEASKQFADLGKKAHKVISDLGLDLSGFNKKWEYYSKKLSKMTDAQMSDLMGEITASFLSSVTQIDFTQFQADGEKIADTVTNMMNAMELVAGLKTLEWDNVNKAGWDIQKLYDSIDVNANSYKVSLDKNAKSIKTAVGELEGLSGADFAAKLKDIGTLISTRYDEEVKYLTYIKTLQQDLTSLVASKQKSYTTALMSENEQFTQSVTDLAYAFDNLNATTDPTKIEKYTNATLTAFDSVISKLDSLRKALTATADSAKSLLESINTKGMSASELATYYSGKVNTAYSNWQSSRDTVGSLYDSNKTTQSTEFYNALTTYNTNASAYIAAVSAGTSAGLTASKDMTDTLTTIQSDSTSAASLVKDSQKEMITALGSLTSIINTKLTDAINNEISVITELSGWMENVAGYLKAAIEGGTFTANTVAAATTTTSTTSGASSIGSYTVDSAGNIKFYDASNTLVANSSYAGLAGGTGGSGNITQNSDGTYGFGNGNTGTYDATTGKLTIGGVSITITGVTTTTTTDATVTDKTWGTGVFTSTSSATGTNSATTDTNSATTDTTSTTAKTAAEIESFYQSLLGYSELMTRTKTNASAALAALGTTAETWKTDALAAIDAGASDTVIQQWQDLATAMDTATSAAKAYKNAMQAQTDFSNSLLSQTDLATATQTQLDALYTEMGTSATTWITDAQAAMESGLLTTEQLQSWKDLQTAVTAATNAAKAEADRIKSQYSLSLSTMDVSQQATVTEAYTTSLLSGLGTTATTWKTDLQAAMEGVLTPEQLQKWQDLATAMGEASSAASALAAQTKTQYDLSLSTMDVSQQATVTEAYTTSLLSGLSTTAGTWKEDLQTAMAGTLTPEQLAKWQALATAMGAASSAAAALAAQTKSNNEFYVTLLNSGSQVAYQQNAANTALSALGATESNWKELAAAAFLSGDTTQEVKNQWIALSAIMTSLTTAQSNYTTSLSTYKSAVQTAYNTESAALQTTIDKMNGFTTSLKKLRESLLLGTASTLSPEAKYTEALRQFNVTSAKAKLGDATAIEELSGISNEFLSASKDYYATSAQYSIDFALVQSTLSQVESVTTNAANTAEEQLTEMKKLVSGILDLNENVQTLTEAMAAYAAAVSNISVTVTNVTTTSSNSPAAGVTYDINGNMVYQQGYGWSKGPDGHLLLDGHSTGGVRPSFAIGTPYVPYDMPANIHEGEIIVDASSAQALRKYGIKVVVENKASNDTTGKETVAELKALVNLQSAANQKLIEEMSAMRKELQETKDNQRLQKAAA